MDSVLEIIRAEVSNDVQESTAIDELGLDSLELLELQLELEKRFSKLIEPEAYTRMETVGDLVRAFA